MRKISTLIAAGVSFAALIPATVMAQAAPGAAASDEDDDIIVTGTLLRGISVPTGTQPISVDVDTIADKAAGSTNELLSLVPQISNTFNGRFEGDPRGIAAGISVTKPNLRGLPGFNSSSGGTTLVLMDGFRFAPVGVNQSANDVDIIPAAILSGIQVVAGGGSSLYGADAVSGVLNFTTLRKFEGIKVDANYGFGTTIKGHKQWDAQLTAGTSWETGNAYISGGYSHRSLVLNNETDWATGEVYNATGTTSRFVGTSCNTPQITEARWFRFGPGATQFTNNPLAPGAGTFSTGAGCDNVGQNTYSPEQRRYNVFAAVTNDFSDSVSMRVTGYYTKRDTTLGVFPRGFTSRGSGIASAAQLTAAFPAALAIAPNTVFAVTEGVGFSFAPNAAYVNTPNTVGFTTWGVTPELTVKVGSNWQVKATAHFGRSSNSQSFPGTDSVKAQNYITGAPGIAAGQLNPLNVAAASAAVIQDITNFTNAQDTKQQLFVGRVVADGTVFSLGDRDVKLAVGVEYQTNKAAIRLNSGTFGSLDALPFTSYSRNAKSAFAEINVPIASFLDVTGSLRWDDYSDFGSTTNPNIGATFKPADWLKIYGHWNKSFNAPTAVDGLGIANGRFACGIYVVNSANPASRPNNPVGRDNGQGTCALILDGVKAGVTPQTGESWAFGFEITPTTGMKFGAEFYSIDFSNLLGAVNPQNLGTYLTNPELYIYNRDFTGVVGSSTTAVGTPTTYAAILSQVLNGAALSAQQAASTVSLVVDRRSSNFGSAELDGVDFHLNYTTETELGQVSVGMNANYKTRVFTNFGVFVDETPIAPKILGSLNFGLKRGGFSSRLTVNYSGKWLDPNPTLNNISRAPIASFTTANLSLGCDFGESSGALEGTSLRLIIDNIGNEKPQRVQRIGSNVQTYENWTIGRVIKLGISKKF